MTIDDIDPPIPRIEPQNMKTDDIRGQLKVLMAVVADKHNCSRIGSIPRARWAACHANLVRALRQLDTLS